MKRGILVLSGIFLFFLTWRGFRNLPSQASPPAVSDARPVPSHVSPGEITSPADTTELAVAVESLRLLDAASDAKEDISVIQQLLEEYRRHHAGNPVGDNDEITAALCGANPKKLAYLAQDVKRLVNADGCLLDRWGQPYFFHAKSGTEMEVISAGPDGILHTEDDLAGE